MKSKEILLDMDGVLADFFTAALAKCQKAGFTQHTNDSYVKLNEYNMAKAFGISQELFWSTIEKDNFWENLNPMPGAYELLEWLQTCGRITIASSPSQNNSCIPQKLRWLYKHFKLEAKDCMFGSRKELLASKNTVLIDDYPVYVDKFSDAGGYGILVSSNWNTHPARFKPGLVQGQIENHFIYL